MYETKQEDIYGSDDEDDGEKEGKQKRKIPTDRHHGGKKGETKNWLNRVRAKLLSIVDCTSAPCGRKESFMKPPCGLSRGCLFDGLSWSPSRRPAQT